MKNYLLFLLTVTVLNSATIDENLYNQNDKEAYYLTIEKSIAEAEKAHLRSKTILKEERHQLSRVRSAATQDLSIETYNIKILYKDKVPLDTFYTQLTHLASLYLKLNQYHQILTDIQSKLVSYKENIINITKENKAHLLSYQLQFAYYKLQQKNIEAKIVLIKKHEVEIRSALTNGIQALECKKLQKLTQKINTLQLQLEDHFKKKVSLQLLMEKAIIDDNSHTDAIMKKITSAQQSYQKVLKEKTVLQIKNTLCLLKEKHDAQFFKSIAEIEAGLSYLHHDDQDFFSQQLLILKELAKNIFGTTKLFFGSTVFESKEIFGKFLNFFSKTLFVFNERPISLLSILKVIFIIILGFIIGILYKKWVERFTKKWPDLSQMSIRLASNIGYYLVIITAFIFAAGSIGIDMSSISLIAGALSIGIGFGLQTVVSNFIAGIILMFERTIRIGDTIEISDMFRGRVTDIRIRSTTIKTFDNIDIVVPNSSFIKDNVINWTLEDPNRRLHIPFSVAYGTEVDDVKEAIFEELENSDLKYIRNSSIMSPEIWMTSMNSSSVDYELLVWVEWSNKLRSNSMRSDFMILIYKALNKHGIKIPFPQLDLYVKQMPQ